MKAEELVKGDLFDYFCKGVIFCEMLGRTPNGIYIRAFITNEDLNKYGFTRVAHAVEESWIDNKTTNAD